MSYVQDYITPVLKATGNPSRNKIMFILLLVDIHESVMETRPKC